MSVHASSAAPSQVPARTVDPRARHGAERSTTPLWVWPALSGAAGVVAAFLLGWVRPEDGPLARLWPSDTSAAAALLQVVATATVTVTSLTFSITVVALQLASQQYSPRLLRTFVQDPVIKAVLAVLTATFTYSLAGLRGLHEDRPVATLLCLGAALLGLASFAAILAFTTHMVRTLRVDTMMLRVHDETRRAIQVFYPPYGAPSVRSPAELDLDETAGRVVPAGRSGYVRSVDVGCAVTEASRLDVVIRVEVRPGDHVTAGEPIALAWTAEGREPGPEVDDVVHRAVVVDYERTIEQDAAFGIRQLEDIAVKAMSPGINDPATAAAAVGHMADLLVRVVGCRLGPTLHEDDDGVGRVVVPDRDLRYYLDLACGQLRRFGRHEPTVLIALLRVLRDVARACCDDEQRAEVARAADLVTGELSAEVTTADADGVHDLRRRVSLALAGQLWEAYTDRAGETRSH